MRRLIYTALCMLLTLAAQAQQDPIFSTYLSNKLVLNPAYAGSRDAISISMQARQQWVGFSGAPKTALLTAHMPTGDMRHGFGLVLATDRWGHAQTTQFAGQYAYRIPLGENSNLALGLKAGLRSFRLNYDGVPLWDAGDEAFNGGNIYSKAQMVVAPGIYFQNDYFYAGLSVNDIVPHKIYETASTTTPGKTATHVFGMIGAAIPAGEALRIKPSILIRGVNGAPLGTDLSLLLSYKNRVGAGITWRPRNALAFVLQSHITKTVQLGYAYDLGLNAIRDYTTGSHELMLGLDLNFKAAEHPEPSPF